ncbi:MAG: rhodanese-like domain-containing protein [Myxococcota bacterium]
MSKPYDFSPGRPLSEAQLSERLLRVNWNTSVRKDERGVPWLKPEFVAEQGRAVLVVDVRERDELVGPQGHLPGSAWIPAAEIERVAREVPDDTLLVLVSSDGQRSGEAALRLLSLGLDWVAAMEGGVAAWKDRGFATSRDEAIFQRTQLAKPAVPQAPAEKRPLTREDIAAHLGDPRTVRWAKMAGFLLHGKTSCVDGRDDHGVVGTPGGDSGEFVLTLGAVERVLGRPIDDAALPALLGRYVDAFGHFYLHSDVGALNRYIARMRADPRIPEASLPARTDPPQAWRRFSAGPPEAIRPFVLEHLVHPDSVGCGHLKFMLTRSEAYGLRPGLVDAFLRACFTSRWSGLIELEFVPLGGGHREGAVVNVRLEDVQPYTQVPLVSPSVLGLQMFVNHPEVTAFQRSLICRFFCRELDLGLSAGDLSALVAEQAKLGAQQMAQTLGALAGGLPIYDVRFRKGGAFEVEPAGFV